MSSSKRIDLRQTKTKITTSKITTGTFYTYIRIMEYISSSKMLRFCDNL